jgi:hypothetical protein
MVRRFPAAKGIIGEFGLFIIVCGFDAIDVSLYDLTQEALFTRGVF